MNPMALWMQSSLFWIRIFKQQQDAYLRVLGQFAEKIPHEDAAELSREAEALKSVLKSKPSTPAAKPKAEKAELETA